MVPIHKSSLSYCHTRRRNAYWCGSSFTLIMLRYITRLGLKILFLVLCTQESNGLLGDINAGLHRMAPERRPHLAAALMRFNFVELIQKMWQRRLRPQLLEHDEELPPWLRASLDVIS